MSNVTQNIVSRLWSLCHMLRDDAAERPPTDRRGY